MPFILSFLNYPVFLRSRDFSRLILSTSILQGLVNRPVRVEEPFLTSDLSVRVEDDLFVKAVTSALNDLNHLFDFIDERLVPNQLLYQLV